MFVALGDYHEIYNMPLLCIRPLITTMESPLVSNALNGLQYPLYMSFPTLQKERSLVVSGRFCGWQLDC